MKNKLIKSLLIVTIIIPSVSFAFFDSVSDGLDKVSNSAKQTNDMSNQTKVRIDKFKNLSGNYEDDTEAKQYVNNKVDEYTSNKLSKTKDASDNINQTKDSLSKTRDSFKSFFSK